MSALQKRFKLLSFALMGLGLLQVVVGVLVLVSSPGAGIFHVALTDSAEGPLGAGVLGALALVVGVLGLAAGVVGARTANSPRDIHSFRVLDFVFVAIALVEIVLVGSGGALAWPELVLAILGLLGFIAAVKANEEALNR